jgi:hypothetical protein
MAKTADKAKHAPTEKRALDDVLKSLQDLLRNDLPAASPPPDAPVAAPDLPPSNAPSTAEVLHELQAGLEDLAPAMTLGTAPVRPADAATEPTPSPATAWQDRPVAMAATPVPPTLDIHTMVPPETPRDAAHQDSPTASEDVAADVLSPLPPLPETPNLPLSPPSPDVGLELPDIADLDPASATPPIPSPAGPAGGFQGNTESSGLLLEPLESLSLEFPTASALPAEPLLAERPVASDSDAIPAALSSTPDSTTIRDATLAGDTLPLPADNGVTDGAPPVPTPAPAGRVLEPVPRDAPATDAVGTTLAVPPAAHVGEATPAPPPLPVVVMSDADAPSAPPDAPPAASPTPGVHGMQAELPLEPALPRAAAPLSALPVEPTTPAVPGTEAVAVREDMTHWDDIPVLEDAVHIPDTPTPGGGHALLPPDQARRVAIQVAARLNVELRRSGKRALASDVITRLARLLQETLAQAAPNVDNTPHSKD